MMLPHKQAIFGNGADGAVPGNCMQVALASLLELPVKLVPHFALFDHSWRSAIWVWLHDRGKKLQVYTDRPVEANEWQRTNVEAHALEYAPSGQMMIASGDSPRGPWGHVVLWKAGEMVHDPHPDASGFNGDPWEFWQVTDA